MKIPARLPRGWYASLLALAMTCAVGAARAGDPVAAPADDPAAAYERGQTAFESKDYATAARSFARADELAPSNAALESALKAALLADHAPLGMELAERADGRKVPPSITVLVERARKTFATRAGRLTVRCPPPATTCTVGLDDEPITPGKPVWALVGERTVTVTSDGATRRERVEVRAGTTVELVPGTALPAPSATTSTGTPSTGASGSTDAGAPPGSSAHPDDASASSGISPVFFVVTAVATGILAGVTIWSGVDTLALHDDFEAGDLTLRDAGQDAQLRTNLLIGFAAGGGAATIILGFVTDFGGSGPASSPAASRSTLLLPRSF